MLVQFCKIVYMSCVWRLNFISLVSFPEQRVPRGGCRCTNRVTIYGQWQTEYRAIHVTLYILCCIINVLSIGVSRLLAPAWADDHYVLVCHDYCRSVVLSFIGVVGEGYYFRYDGVISYYVHHTTKQALFQVLPVYIEVKHFSLFRNEDEKRYVKRKWIIN